MLKIAAAGVIAVSMVACPAPAPSARAEGNRQPEVGAVAAALRLPPIDSLESSASRVSIVQLALGFTGWGNPQAFVRVTQTGQATSTVRALWWSDRTVAEVGRDSVIAAAYATARADRNARLRAQHGCTAMLEAREVLVCQLAHLASDSSATVLARLEAAGVTKLAVQEHRVAGFDAERLVGELWDGRRLRWFESGIESEDAAEARALAAVVRGMVGTP